MREFLVIEDDTLVARSFARSLAAHGHFRLLHSFAEGMEALAERRSWAGFIVDLALGDGSGIDLLVAARERHPDVPALVVTGAELERRLVNSIEALDARLLQKPVEASDFSAFIARVEARERPLASVVQRAVHRWKLSNREGQVLQVKLLHEDRAAFLAQQGITEHTWKTYEKRIREKTGYSEFDLLFRDLLANKER